MWKMKRILLISFGIVLFLILLFIQIIKAQTNNFSVKWTLVHDGISHKEYLVEIQNLDSDSERDFNLESIIRNTNFPLQQVKDFYIYEWIALPKEFPTYDVRTVSQTCYNNQTGEAYDCSYNKTYQNGTVTKLQNDWKPTKMQLIVDSDKVKADYGLITIPKYDSKAKTDDFGGIETVNGIKKFKIAFNVPVTRNAFGFGSSGEIGILDLNTNNYYHPWWNSSWQKKRNVTINNTLNSNTLSNYQVAINITYDSDMQPDFDDLRFVDSDDSTELSYWIENKTDSQWAYVWIKIPSIPALSTKNIEMYYGNPAVSTTSNITTTFILGDDFTGADNSEPNTALWSNTVDSGSASGSVTKIENNQLNVYFKSPDGTWKFKGIRSISTISAPVVIEGKMKHTESVTENSADAIDEAFQLDPTITTGSPEANSNYWRWAGIDDGASEKAHAGKKVSGTYTSLADNTSILSDNLMHNWTMIFKSDKNLTVYYDGVKQYSGILSDLTFTSGYLYLYTWSRSTTFNNVTWDNIKVRSFSEPEPTYSIGAEEYLAITIFSPLNQTYYGVSNIEAKFKAEDSNNAIFSIKAWLDSELKYENNSYSNNTNITLNLENLVGKSYNFTVLADNGIFTNSKTVIFYNWHGLNISIFQANGTAISSWNLLSKNSTNEIYFSGKTNPSFFEWKDLTQGESNLTVNASLFDNETKSFIINNSMGFQQVNFTLYRIQEWRAKNNNTLADIQNFSALFSNGTFNAYFTTTNYKINPSLRELPFGNVSAKFSSLGFNDTWVTYNINSSSVLNKTVYLNPAGLKIDVWDEKTLEKLNFNVTIANSTHSNTTTNQNTFSALWNEILNGDITITIIDLNGIRVQRKYFATLTEYTYIYLKGYLLKSTDGMVVRFHIRTAEESPIANATFAAKKFISDEWQIVEQAKSDDSGVATVFLDPLATYSITVEHPNYATFSSSVQPSSQDYRIYLQKLYGELPKIIFDDVSYYILPHEMNASLTNVTFYINCTSGTLEYFGMNITLMYSNHSVEELYYVKITDKPYGDTLIASFDLTNKSGSEVTVKAFLKKQNFDEYEITNKYYIYSVTPGSYSLWTLITSLIPSSPWVAGTTTLATGILSLIVTGIGTSVVARKTLVGAGIVAIILLGIFTFMGWFSWKIYLLVCLVAISIMFLRGVI
jgi:hypothetical protein